MARISIDGVGKDAPGPRAREVARTTTRILGQVSLEVGEGELLVLVGPSGCGKTTLLRCIAGLEEITRGELRFDGQRMNEVGPRERDVAMVFQSYALYPHLTVRENLGFALSMRRTPAAEMARRVDEAAAMLEIGHLLDRLPRQLSGGQRQRVAMGRAVVRRPRVFLFDEPLSNLDAALRGQMRVELKRLHARLGATMIYVTHDQVEAMTLADRIVLMRGGAVVQVGTPDDLYRRPATLFAARFFGTPEMNTIEGRIELGDDAAWFTAGPDPPKEIPDWQREPAPHPHREGVGRTSLSLNLTPWEWVARRVTLGVRAEDVRLGAPGSGMVDGQVDVLENLGPDTLVHLLTAGQRLVARVDSTRAPRSREVVGISFDLKRIHLFGAGDDGARIELAQTAATGAAG